MKELYTEGLATHGDPGSLQFHIHRNRFDRNVIVIYGVWDIGALRRLFEMP